MNIFKNILSRLQKRQPQNPKGRVLVIGGGEIFDTYSSYLSWLRELKLRDHSPSWKSWLTKELSQHNLEVIRVSMPNTFNAKYEEWEIMFSKYLALIDSNTSLVGHSLGAMFLLKFLSKNPDITTIVKGVYLVAPEFKNAYTFACPKKSLPNHSKFRFYQSKDDDIVTWETSTTKVVMDSNLSLNRVFTFEDRGHFIDATFSEIYHHLVEDYQ